MGPYRVFGIHVLVLHEPPLFITSYRENSQSEGLETGLDIIQKGPEPCIPCKVYPFRLTFNHKSSPRGPVVFKGASSRLMECRDKSDFQIRRCMDIFLPPIHFANFFKKFRLKISRHPKAGENQGPVSYRQLF